MVVEWLEKLSCGAESHRKVKRSHPCFTIPVLQIRRGNRDNLEIIIQISS